MQNSEQGHTYSMLDMAYATPGRQSSITEDELPALQDKAVALLDILQRNLPEKTGEKSKWNFEKAHSILHKVREIILWGKSDNTSCQGPEVCYNVYKYIHVYTTI
jgi:hypothetical protein